MTESVPATASATSRNTLANDFAGSSVVVTGGARGSGLATAKAFASSGAKVVIVDLDAGALEEANAEVGGAFGTVAVDLTGSEVGDKVGAALNGLPPLRVWVNNAGIVSHQTADEVTIADFEAVQQKNVSTVLNGAKIARAHFGQHEDHSIVNISSEAALRAMARRLSYGVSKTAVLGITRYLAHEWGPQKIRVNAICPGHIATRLTDFNPDGPDAAFHKQMLASLPIPRRGAPADIAGAALFLSSSLATYVTGQALPVDGGWSLI
jgi:2-dehydro-3-deoxy-D-gluconate 5-dehydrogenase